MNKPTRNDEATITIERTDQEGRGVARVDGFVWLVSGALTGETIRARVIKPYANYAVARVEDIIAPSPSRVEPACPIYTRCGGCSFLHCDYAESARVKESYVRDCLARIGGIANPNMLPILTPEPSDRFRYRNKAAIPVAGDARSPIAGCYAKRSHDVIDLSSVTGGCLLQHESSHNVTVAALDWMKRSRITPYNEQTHTGIVRHIVTRVNADGCVMVTLVINARGLGASATDSLIRAIREAAPQTTHISLSRNVERTNVIINDECELIWGEPTIIETLRTNHGDLRYALSPRSFFQVNTRMAGKLADTVVEYAELTSGSRVADIYCGAGSLTLALARVAASVTGVELSPDAIRDARHNASMNGTLNASFIEGDAAEALPRLVGEQAFDVIVLDPPRKGCDEAVLRAAASAKPEGIVYVSCDPATLARDAKVLYTLGYTLAKARPIDQFCHTSAVEVVARFGG